MNHTSLKTAIAEAERFLERAKKAERGFAPSQYGNGTRMYNDDHTATAAAKRASMDLTRALAQLRKAN